MSNLINITKKDIVINSITKNGNAFVDISVDQYYYSVLMRRDNFNAILRDVTITGAIVEQSLPDKQGNLGAPMKIFKTLKF